jgi:hypothetical protein
VNVSRVKSWSGGGSYELVTPSISSSGEFGALLQCRSAATHLMADSNATTATTTTCAGYFETLSSDLV